jgi:hypothetical protein
MSSGELAAPSNGWFSFNDMAHVMYEGNHVLYTSSTSRYFGSMKMDTFGNWTDMASAKQQGMPTSFIALAPTLFLFRPTNTWVMAYQGQSSLAYRTTKDPSSLEGWSDEKTLFSGKITAPYVPSDPTIIGDGTNMHLFFANKNGTIYRASMPIGNFPGDFGAASTVVLSDTQENLYESVQVYTVKGQNKYLMLVEGLGVNGRYIRSFTATDLSGTWTPQAATEAKPFAGKVNSGASWTNDVSHADVIRSDPDETMTIDACNMQVLFQGAIDKSLSGTRFRPAVLTLQN